MADLVRCMKWARRTRGGQWPGARLSGDLVQRVGRQQVRWLEMEECKWRTMLETALLGVDLDDPREGRGRIRMLVSKKKSIFSPQNWP